MNLSYLQRVQRFNKRHHEGIEAIERALRRKGFEIGGSGFSGRVITYGGREVGILRAEALAKKITVRATFGGDAMHRFPVVGTLQYGDKDRRPKYRQFGANVGAVLKRKIAQRLTMDVMDS